MTYLIGFALFVLVVAGVLCLVHSVAVAIDTFCRDRQGG